MSSNIHLLTNFCPASLIYFGQILTTLISGPDAIPRHRNFGFCDLWPMTNLLPIEQTLDKNWTQTNSGPSLYPNCCVPQPMAHNLSMPHQWPAVRLAVACLWPIHGHPMSKRQAYHHLPVVCPMSSNLTNSGQTLDMEKLWTRFGFQQTIDNDFFSFLLCLLLTHSPAHIPGSAA